MWKLEQHLTWDFFSCTSQTTVPSFCLFIWDTGLSFMSLKDHLVFFELYYGYHLYDQNAHMPVGYKSTLSIVRIHLKRCATSEKPLQRELDPGWRVRSLRLKDTSLSRKLQLLGLPTTCIRQFQMTATKPRLTQPDLYSNEHGWPKCFLTHLARTELSPVT